jgi:hypothetical protein
MISGIYNAIAGIAVQAGTPADGQQLQYSLATNEWEFV